MRTGYLRPFICICISMLLTIIVFRVSRGQTPARTGSLTRITMASDSTRDSDYASVSADGTLIAFESTSDFYHEGMPSDIPQLWLYDTTTMSLTRVTSVTHDTNSAPRSPSISADGSVIAFSSHDFLNEGLSTWQEEIWLYDTTAMTFTRVTTSGVGRGCRFPSMNADGTVVAFESNADLLGEGRSIYHYEIWLADTKSMTYTRITTGTGDNAYSTRPSVNADGTSIAFQSDADLLNQGIPQGQDEIWLYNTQTRVYTRVTTASDAERDSRYPHVSSDGTLVVFESDSDFLGEGIPAYQYEIWLYDTVSEKYTRITTSPDSDRVSLRPRISADGRLIVFNSNSDFRNEGIPSPFTFEIWLYDTEQEWLSRITTGADDGQSSINPSINFDGTDLDITFTSGTAASYPGIPTQKEIWRYEGEPVALSYVYLPLVLGRH